jgi:hypothetical protein
MASGIVKAIASSGLTIYDSLETRPELYIDIRTLERILNRALVGLDLDYPNRTRSKVLKSSVCQALGYPVPKSFRFARLSRDFPPRTSTPTSRNPTIYKSGTKKWRRQGVMFWFGSMTIELSPA